MRRAAGNVAGSGDALFSCWREFHFYRRKASHHAESCRGRRRADARKSRHEGDAACLRTAGIICASAWRESSTALRGDAQLRALDSIRGINLCSNDYLGLAGDERLKRAVIEAVEGCEAVGSTGSRLLSGNSRSGKSSRRNSRDSRGPKRRCILARDTPRMLGC